MTATRTMRCLGAGGGLALCALLLSSCAGNNPRLDCGNGVLDSEELCDDGNRDPGDGCDSDCRIESGFSCFGEPSVCQTGCGDSSVAGYEECDDGNLLPGDGCSAGCALEPGYTCAGEPSVCVTTCGDGALAAAEGCDDGNLLAGDGCGAGCEVENGWTCTGSPSVCAALCGNHTIDPEEECDGAQLNGQSCTTVPGGFTGGDLACSTSCAFDIGGCISAGCGNGIIDSGEMCDDGDIAPGDGCTANCQVEAGWACSGTPSVCVELCGNGTLDYGEDCDGSLLGGATCSSVPGGFTGGTLACDGSCQYNTVGCTTCGNNIPELGEECDDGNMVAGDGCSPTCANENLPVLYYATGDPAVWGSMTITYAGEPHAPQTPILAAANADQRGYAYLFTASTYHQLSLPGHQWVGSGNLATRFPGVPGAQLKSAVGISWPADTDTALALITVSGVDAMVYMYSENNTTGAVELDPGFPDALDWTGDPLAPPETSGKAAFQTLNNANGWTHHDVYNLCVGTEPTTPPGADVGPYTAIITNGNDIYNYNASYCWVFYESMPLSQFTPFTEFGAPTPSDVVAAFYSTAHGDRLYVVIQP